MQLFAATVQRRILVVGREAPKRAGVPVGQIYS